MINVNRRILIEVIILCLAFVSFASGEERGIGTAASCEKKMVTTEIAYKSEYIIDPNRYLDSGKVIIQAGKCGTKTSEYVITYEDGVETGRYDSGEQIVAPVNEIISVPSKNHVVEIKEETVTEAIGFKTETTYDPNRMKGKPEIVAQEGKNGVKTLVYTVTYTDGVETGRILKDEFITAQPVNQIISVATGDFTETYETETVDIPFITIYEDSPNWFVGEEKVSTEGQNGQKEITYLTRKDMNGNEISRTISNEKILRKVVNRVVCRGTFVSVVTYEVVYVPDLPECDASKRNNDLDEQCTEWAMNMAVNNEVKHSHLGFGESVGGWGSIDQVVYGRNYSVISTQNRQLYTGNVSLGSHGGECLANADKWGAGCVIRYETQPDGTTSAVYYACARSDWN